MYSLISSREHFREIKAARRDRQTSRSAKENPYSYRRFDQLTPSQVDEVREALVFREIGLSEGQVPVSGESFRANLASLPLEFDLRFQRMDSLTKDLPTTRRLLRRVLRDLAEDRVQYVEIMVNPFDKASPDPRGVNEVFGKGSEAAKELTSVLSTNSAEFGVLCAEHVLRRYIDEVNSVRSELARSHGGSRRPTELIDARFLLATRRVGLQRKERIEECFELVSRFRRHPLARYRERVVGINIMGNEFGMRDRPTDYLQSILPQVTKHGSDCGVSLHAGESGVDDGHTFDSILLGAQRLGHGLSLKYSQKASTMAFDRGICIEACPLSNKFLGFTPDLGNHHPLRTWIDRGQRVCLNTDDPGLFETSQTDEFYFAALAFDLTLAEIRKLCEESLSAAFITDAQRTVHLNDFQVAFDQYVSTFQP